MHEPRKLPRSVRSGLHERDDLPPLDLERDDARVVAVDRARPGDHLVEHHPDGVEVRARVDLVGAAGLLGRHVLGRAHDDAGDGELLLLRIGAPRLGDAEVDELEEGLSPAERDEHVLGLEVAVDDAERVRRLERLEDLRRVVARRRHRQPPLALHHRRQRLALQQLHHDVRVAVGRAVHVRHLHDVGAADLRRDARLLEEPLDESRAARELRVEHLDGDPRPEHGVLALVDRAHAAVAEEPRELVLAVDVAADADHAG